VSGCGVPDLHRGANASAGFETIVVMTCGFLRSDRVLTMTTVTQQQR
jgi:hypothetical protein